MNLQQLQQQIKNKALANFYVVTGNEDVLIYRAQQAFRQLIQLADRDMNYAQFDLIDQALDEVINDAMSMPFFGDRRVVVVQNPEFLTAKGKISVQNQEQLVKLLEKPIAENIVVFFINDLKIDKRKKMTKTLLKYAENIELPALNESQSRQAITQELQQRAYKIEQDALQELILRTNAHYTAMKNELPKLIAYATHTKNISLEAVTTLVPKTLTATIFDLVDAVMTRQSKKALLIYRDLLQNGEPALRINAVLTGQFRLLLQIAGLKGTEQDMSKQLGIHPYRIKLAHQMLKKYLLASLRDSYLGMVGIEVKLKSTNQEPALLFERFILKNTL
ncbi:DNA polymerase III subunit delta [Leuconostoc gasicomitatum]|uniref:DNA polymerase III subunit delta n=1 Tax=Leuconostoc gasicomitatum TaxID=115778 RepID=UPI000BD48C14|nr:DNA polymerase III subunit delta [Leuconostoc gasicomitatum]MBZ5949336.1 DNA polymerase III subunit delta [Leuconostoc gasicomitatum]MBZ5951177.1 DNA polymerase III subunit delta [Leuconostoc gasicomitatum]MBZ5958552.1 DNA polymerase III subunit delta [Leuconostoc gasicomitatum]MBZ5967347.1 DNA polymerase III subunit delta [Leuconostoc gasicomitatum]MBZ5971282.1 DNA polymerase III subunit delta [Leuconostoc gasicomitatum]